jgi:hypothetical protein
MVGDHYEVKVDGAWTPVPYDKINNVIAPDGGAHLLSGRRSSGGQRRCVAQFANPPWRKIAAISAI